MVFRTPPKLEDKVCVGVIIGAHSIKGELKVRSFTVAERDITAYGTLVDEHQRPFVITNVKGGANKVQQVSWANRAWAIILEVAGA